MTLSRMYCVCASLLLLGAAFLNGACSRPEDRAAGDGSGDPSAGSMTIKGSDTMVHLVSAWNEAYMDAHPEANIALTGGGSGTGIAAILNGTTDLCMASRNMKEEELSAAREKGLELDEITVARDGIAIALNPQNPITTLTMEQLEKIFTGAYTRWSEVGGPDQPIALLSRESNSGTYVFFQEHVLNKKDFPPSARLLASNTAIVQALQSDQWSIGYIGLGYAAEAGATVKVLGVSKDAGSEPVHPSNESVLSGQYPIARALYFYCAKDKSPLANDFLQFCLSPEGQKIVADAGYVPLG